MALPPWRQRLDGLGFSSEEKGNLIALLLDKAPADREVAVDTDPQVAAVTLGRMLHSAVASTPSTALTAGAAAATATSLREEPAGPAAQAQAPPAPASVTVHVEVVEEELGYSACSKITLQYSQEGDKQLQGYMRQWDAWGLWDKTTRGPSGDPYIVNKVEDLQHGVTYLAYIPTIYGSSSKGFKRLDRQLQNTGNKYEVELEKATVHESCTSGHSVEARPDLHVLSSKVVNMELDAVALGEHVAIIAEHEESACLTKDNKFGIVDEVTKKASLISTLANDPAYADTNFAAFKGRQITPGVMYEYVDPKFKTQLETECALRGVQLYRRNGSSISRVPLKPVALLGGARRFVPWSHVRLV